MCGEMFQMCGKFLFVLLWRLCLKGENSCLKGKKEFFLDNVKDGWSLGIMKLRECFNMKIFYSLEIMHLCMR